MIAGSSGGYAATTARDHEVRPAGRRGTSRGPGCAALVTGRRVTPVTRYHPPEQAQGRADRTRPTGLIIAMDRTSPARVDLVVRRPGAADVMPGRKGQYPSTPAGHRRRRYGKGV